MTTCRLCLESNPLDEFGVRAASHEGRKHGCKRCGLVLIALLNVRRERLVAQHG